MAFKKGQSGNPNGRPPGATNKVNTALKERLKDFLDASFDTFLEDFKSLTPRERAKLLVALIEYEVPKLSRAENTINFEALTEDQMDYIINELSKKMQNE